MPGTLVPETYVSISPSNDDIELSSIVWGFSLGVAMYVFFTAAKQTLKAWRRSQKITAYMVFVWLEWIASTVMGIVSWCFLKGRVEPSLEYFIAIVVLWAVQVHTLMQIIINRVGILSVDQILIFRIKWGTFLLLLIINIGVVCIWVPAQLQISPMYEHINAVSDRLQKALICVIDASLNIYFIHLVHSRLISNGLTKYKRLFRFNIFMIIVSMALDLLIVAMMSLDNKLLYIQFHPLAYLLKLQIELGMADLIVKIVRAINPQIGSSDPYPRYGGTTATGGGGATTGVSGLQNKLASWYNSSGTRHHRQQLQQPQQHNTHVGLGSQTDAVGMEMYSKAIRKTVVTEVVTDDAASAEGAFRADGRDTDDEGASSSSSTRELGATKM